MNTPCCTDDSLIYLLAFAFLVSLFFYLHKPHRPSHEFHSDIERKITNPFKRWYDTILRRTHLQTHLQRMEFIREGMRQRGLSYFKGERGVDGSTEGFTQKGGDADTDSRENTNDKKGEEKDERVVDTTPPRSKRTIEEWSEHKRRRTFDVQVEPYNSDYMKVYDKLTYSNVKFDYEVGIIMHHLKKARLFSGVLILDVGCGSGNHVAHLRNNRYEVIGLDKSDAAISFCKKRHSDHAESYRVGDVMLPTQFREKMFTHILCLNSTIYYMDDARLFFKNCATWLKTGGLLFLHMIDDFEQRYYDTNGWIKLKDGTKYKSSYDIHKGKTYVDEKIKDTNGNVLLNKHVMHNVGETEKLLRYADKSGLVVIRKYSLKKVGFKHHYMYVLKK